MGIQSIPAVIAFVNGQPADGFMGALPESQVIAFLERLTKGKVGAEDKDLLKAADAALAEGDAAGAADLYAQLLAEDAGNVAGARRPCALLCRRPARSSRPSRRSPWCRKPSATTPRSRPRAPRSNSPSRRSRVGPIERARAERSPPIRSTIRRASISPSRSTPRASARRRSSICSQIVKRDRKWNEDGARKQLVQFFEAWGPTDEATVEGRKRLSSILFA